MTDHTDGCAAFMETMRRGMPVRREPSLEERVARLEAAVASVERRLKALEIDGNGERG